jgi:dTDP-4-amino-4,6-dideoxygalactose transaminase
MRALRPVGAYVPLFPSQTGSDLPDLTCGGRYAVRFLNSGTAALSLALAYCARRSASTGADALLPAYGCPDLIAAAVAADVNARLIDIEPDSPWLDLRKVTESSGNAAALVAVNFLGMRERLEELLVAARARGVPLIEDSAQMAPFSAGSQPAGDLVVYSFGRGKPLTLLSGGALLIRSDWAHELDQLYPSRPARNGGAFAYWAKCIAYNTAIHPFSYAGLRRLPFLALGQVAYRPLGAIEAMDTSALARLPAAYARHLKQPSVAQRALTDRLRSIEAVATDLPTRLERSESPLLRYPVLMRNEATRDLAVARLDAAGLGASPFYARSLIDISGVPGVAGQIAPNAKLFAGRLLTLPVHADVTPNDVDHMISILGSLHVR